MNVGSAVESKYLIGLGHNVLGVILFVYENGA